MEYVGSVSARWPAADAGIATRYSVLPEPGLWVARVAPEPGVTRTESLHSTYFTLDAPHPAVEASAFLLVSPAVWLWAIRSSIPRRGSSCSTPPIGVSARRRTAPSGSQADRRGRCPCPR